MMYQRILVTGGCGFIGSNLVRFLLDSWPEARVVNLDALTYAGNPENLADLQGHGRYTFVHGRVEDARIVDQILQSERIEAVMHLAAESHVDRSIRGPQVFITTNVVGTHVLLDAAIKHGVRRFLYVSTDEVFGTIPGERLADEEAPFSPSNPYAAAKAAADLLTLAYGRTYGLDVVVARPSNNFGPHQFPEKLIPLTIINALEDQPIPLYGDGFQVRDWLFVKDHCHALGELLFRGKSGSVYNIGGGNLRTNLQVVTRVLEILGKDQSLLRPVKDRPGHDRRYAMSTHRIRSEIGWSATKNFDEGLVETVKWYLEQRDWWERIRRGEYQKYYREQYGDPLAAASNSGEEKPHE